MRLVKTCPDGLDRDAMARLMARRAPRPDLIGEWNFLIGFAN